MGSGEMKTSSTDYSGEAFLCGGAGKGTEAGGQ